MNMLQVSYQQALADLDAVLDQAVEQAGVLVIDRPGKPRVALLAEAELTVLLETVHLLRSPANAQRLFAALESSYKDDAVENIEDLNDPCSLVDLLETIDEIRENY